MKLIDKMKLNKKIKKVKNILNVDDITRDVTQLIATVIIHADENEVILLRYIEYNGDGNGDFEISSKLVFEVKHFNEVIKSLIPLNIVIDVWDETYFWEKSILKEYDYYSFIDNELLKEKNIKIVKIN